MQVITLHFISQGEPPVLLLTRKGVLVEQPLALGVLVVVDLLAPHALLPREWIDLCYSMGLSILGVPGVVGAALRQSGFGAGFCLVEQKFV